MKMVVLCPYPMDRAPSQRLRFEKFYTSWRHAGWDVDVRPFWDEQAWEILHQPGHTAAKVRALLGGVRRRLRDLRDALRADLAYVHLEVMPLGPPILERRLVRSDVPVIFDIDDMVHLPRGSSGNPFMQWLRGPSRVLTLLEGAAEVIVCTSFLEEWACRRHPRVTCIPSTVETRVLAPRKHSDADHGVVVGWSGSHSTAPYLLLLEGALRDLAASDGIRIRVIGDENFQLDGLEIEAMPWHLETEVEDLQGIDIGLYPLPHERWVLGKSGGKALQYMASGVPFVAERFGPNEGLFEDGVQGFFANGQREWTDRLRQLIRDPELRRRMGEHGRRLAETKYSVPANEHRYLDVIHRATEGGEKT